MRSVCGMLLVDRGFVGSRLSTHTPRVNNMLFFVQRNGACTEQFLIHRALRAATVSLHASYKFAIHRAACAAMRHETCTGDG